MRIALAVAMLVGAPVAAPADPGPAEWASVATTKDSTAAMFVDMRSIEAKGDGVKQTRQAMVMVPDVKGIFAMTATVLVDCRARRMRKSDIQTYGSDGSLINDRKIVDEWHDAESGTVNEGMVDFVCADNPKEEQPRSTEAVPIAAGRKILLAAGT